MYYELIVLGLVCLGAPWIARQSGFETERKPFDLAGVAGLFFWAATAFGLGMTYVDALKDIGRFLMVGSMVLGWVALGAGAIWSALDVFRESHKELLTHKM